MAEAPIQNTASAAATGIGALLTVLTPSPELASKIFGWANFGLITSLIIGVVSTALIVWTGNIKEDDLKERLAASNAVAKGAERDAAKANEGILKAQADIASAHAAAKEADARAAEANLALARFKAPRLIPAGTAKSMVTALSKSAGIEIAIYVWGEGPEPSALGEAIGDLLLKARWKPLRWNWSGTSPLPGIFVLAKQGSDGKVLAARDALVAALRSAHLQAEVQVWPGEWDKFGGMLNGPNPPAPTAAPLRILIGSKPQ
jgi:hypothetical protein